MIKIQWQKGFPSEEGWFIVKRGLLSTPTIINIYLSETGLRVNGPCCSEHWPGGEELLTFQANGWEFSGPFDFELGFTR